MTLTVDLGQSGNRIRVGDISLQSTRPKRAGEEPVDALRAIFEQTQQLTSDVVALSCTGFNGIVSNPQPFLQLCHEFFGATKVAVMDDGLAGFIGALAGRNGVALTIGGGVVAVGGRDKKFAHRDGLGSIFGDEGSGFWLGKNAITKALGIRQGRGDDQDLVVAFKKNLQQFDELSMKNGADAVTLAIESAQNLLNAADAGIKTAIEIRNEGAFLLGQTVIATWLGAGGKIDESPEITIQGGPARNASYVKLIQENIAAVIAHASFVQPLGDNLDGAQWIAENMTEDAAPLLLWGTTD